MICSEIFGLSNFAAWEVAEVVGICKAKGYVQPKIYQAYAVVFFVGFSSTNRVVVACITRSLEILKGM